MVIVRNLLILIALVGTVRFLLPHLPADTPGPIMTPAAIRMEAAKDPLDPGAVCFDRAEAIDPGYATARVSNKSVDAYVSISRHRLDASMHCLLERNEQAVCNPNVRKLLVVEIEHYFEGARHAALEATLRLDRIKSEKTTITDPEIIAGLQELSKGVNPEILLLLDRYAASGHLSRQDFVGFLGFRGPDPTLGDLFSRPKPAAPSCG